MHEPCLYFDMSTDLCKVPAGMSPSGTSSNFVNPTSLAPTFISVLGVLVSFGTLFTGARIYMNFQKLVVADCKFI